MMNPQHQSHRPTPTPAPADLAPADLAIMERSPDISPSASDRPDEPSQIGTLVEQPAADSEPAGRLAVVEKTTIEPSTDEPPAPKETVQGNVVSAATVTSPAAQRPSRKPISRQPQGKSTRPPAREVALPKPVLPPQVNALLLTIRSRPLMVICSSWLFFVLLAGLSLNALMNPRAVKQSVRVVPLALVESVTPRVSPILSSPEPPPTPDSGQLPLWMLGAIALSCAVGTFALSHQFKPARQPVRPSMRQPVARSVGRTRIMELARIAAEATERATENAMAPAVAALPAMTVPHSQSLSWPQAGTVRPGLSASRPVPASALPPALKRKQPKKLKPTTAPVVTVVPAHEQVPVDRHEPTLVELMDLRSQHPLHSWTDDLAQSEPVPLHRRRVRPS